MSLPNAEVWVDWEIGETGKEYRDWDPDRWEVPYDDCSSLGIKGWRHAGIVVPDSVRNTVGIYNWAKSIGALCSVEKAVRTRGAGLLKGKNFGFGRFGHYATSLGNGTEMAAHGRKSGIHISDVYGGRNYQDGIIFPPGMAFYADLQPPVDPAAFAFLLKLEGWGERVKKHALHMGDPASGDITILNLLLLHFGMLPTHAPMNIFSTFTRDGVVQFKKRHPEIGNIVGKVFGGSAPAVDAILAPR